MLVSYLAHFSKYASKICLEFELQASLTRQPGVSTFLKNGLTEVLYLQQSAFKELHLSENASLTLTQQGDPNTLLLL